MFTIFCASSSMDFNPRPPRGERPAFIRLLHTSMLISIHALREESDAALSPSGRPQRYFNPRPPRGERPTCSQMARRKVLFQSTPSARRATLEALRVILGVEISIHALREESDRLRRLVRRTHHNEFQSTPSARRATCRLQRHADGLQISIHALREESDASAPATGSPCTTFQSTPSARRATGASYSLITTMNDFNPRPPRGERQQKQRKNPMLLFHYTHLCTI